MYVGPIDQKNTSKEKIKPSSVYIRLIDEELSNLWEIYKWCAIEFVSQI